MAINHPVWCDGCRAWRAHALERHQVIKCTECGRITDNSDQANNKGETVLEEGRPSRFCSHCGARVTEEELLVEAQDRGQDHYCCEGCRKLLHDLEGPLDGQQQMAGMPRHNGLVGH